MSHPSTNKAWKSVRPAPVRRDTEVTMDSFYELMMRHLIGRTIVEVGQDSEGFLYFVTRGADGDFKHDISSDQEGNNPGFLFGLPNPYDLYTSPKESKQR